MESALYGIFTLVSEVSEISLVRCAALVRFQILHQLVWKSRTRACAFQEVVSISWTILGIAGFSPVVVCPELGGSHWFCAKYNCWRIGWAANNGRINNRPILLTQCCTQLRSLGVKVLSVFHLHDNIAFTLKWYGNTWNKTFYSQKIWIGYNIELAELVYQAPAKVD